jgi:hypothetical protein
MTQMDPRHLDAMLRNLIANPERLNEVKSVLQSGVEPAMAQPRVARAMPDDHDDLFDNLPV